MVLGASQLHLMWTCFFDDFATHRTVEMFFDLLGWKFAKEGDKASGFNQTFTALGIKISTARCSDGCIEFSNTEKRVAELVEAIDDIVAKGAMDLKQSQKLRGRMQFADSQIFGRVSKLCLKEVTSQGYSPGVKLSLACRTALSRFQNSLLNSEPRKIACSAAKPWFVFTDACYEADSPVWRAGLGGMIFDASGHAVQAFSINLSDDQIGQLGGASKKTIIFELELLALVISINLWSALIAGSPTVFYVDNNSARDVAISGNARSTVANGLLESLLEAEMSANVLPWYGRVPSPSNSSR